MEVSSGVLQGSIVKPLLFLLYINDFPLSVSCSTELFADDSVLYRKIKSEDDCVELQDDLLSAASWCTSWKVTLKSEKCKSLHVSSVGSNKENIWVQRFWGNKNGFQRFSSSHFGIWNPYLTKHIHSIESIQRRATRLTYGSDKSYSDRLAERNWSTLELRRKYFCLVQVYKIIHGYSDVDFTRYVDLTRPTKTIGNHDFKWRPKAARTDYLKFSFLTVKLMTGTLYLILFCQLPVWIPLGLEYWIIFVLSFILLSRNETYSDFTVFLSFGCFSNFFFLIQRIVIYISLRGQYLYGNSVYPYCFPLPTVLLYGN